MEPVELLHTDLTVSHGAQVGARTGALPVARHLLPAHLFQSGHLQTPLERAVAWRWGAGRSDEGRGVREGSYTKAIGFM